jgi:hypothetical protein
MSKDRSVSVVPHYELDDVGLKSRQKAFLASPNFLTISAVQPASYSMGTGILSPCKAADV